VGKNKDVQRDPLTKLQREFVDLFLNNPELNATECVRRSHYNTKYPDKWASQLLGNPRVIKEIKKARERRQKRTQISQDRVLEELARLGFSNIKNYIDRSGMDFITFKDIEKIPEEAARAISSIKVKKKGLEQSIEFKLHSKDKALDMLGQHLGLFDGKHGIKGEILLKIVSKIPRSKEKEKKKVENADSNPKTS